MPKYLIINADDFGMSEAINEGTKIGIKERIITSVSVMPNMPFFDDAVTFLKKNRHISVGLHFNVTEGKPLIYPQLAGNLIREDDNFYHWPSFIFNYMRRTIDTNEILEELKAQYKALKSTGIRISHIDSHHHIHLYPRLFKMFSKFAEDNNIPSVRVHKFNFWNLFLGLKEKPTTTQTIVNAALFLSNLRYKSSRKKEISRFYDINWGQRHINQDKLSRILEKLPEGTTEFICHLASESRTGNIKFLYPRQKTLELLLKPSIKKKLLKNGIELIGHER